MKLLLSLVFLLSIAGHSYANWLYIGASPTGDVFVDISSLKKLRNEVTFHSILNLKEKTNRGTSSMKIETTINCLNKELMDKNMMAYDEVDGKGRMIDSWKPESNWKAIEANSILYKLICSK